MAAKVWRLTDPIAHTVTLEHGYFSGKAVVYVDGEEVFRRGPKVWDTGFENRFKIDEAECIIRVFCRPFSFEYEFWVDGKLK